MRVDLAGRSAVVVGGASGLGRSLAALLELNGALVVREAQTAGAVERLDAFDILVNVEPATPAGIRASKAAAASMAKAGGGRIVHIASITGIVPVRGRADAACPDASTFARTRAMALDHAGDRVLVNAIAALGAEHDRPETRLHAPLGRCATDAEIGNAVLFLLAPANSYMTGHVLAIDGGWSAGFARDF